jgi:hypothetical protein
MPHEWGVSVIIGPEGGAKGGYIRNSPLEVIWHNGCHVSWGKSENNVRTYEKPECSSRILCSAMEPLDTLGNLFIPVCSWHWVLSRTFIPAWSLYWVQD